MTAHLNKVEVAKAIEEKNDETYESTDPRVINDDQPASNATKEVYKSNEEETDLIVPETEPILAVPAGGEGDLVIFCYEAVLIIIVLIIIATIMNSHLL